MNPMINTKKTGVLVFGEPAPVGEKSHIVVHQLLTKAASLAAEQRLPVLLAAFYSAGEKDARCGADLIFDCRQNGITKPSMEVYSEILIRLIRQENPQIVLFGATRIGRMLAPRIAASLKVGITADCTALCLNEEGNLLQTRPAYGGNMLATIITPNCRPQLATVRPNVFSSKERHNVQFRVEPFVVDIASIRQFTEIIKEVIEEKEAVSIEDARILVGIGRGIGSPEKIPLAQEFASLLGGELAASRSVVDVGWMPHIQQVGQSGKTVSPDLYIALGISGAVQHLAGMQSSKKIVAINIDESAPIFRIADMGIVGDLHKVLPQLIQSIKS